MSSALKSSVFRLKSSLSHAPLILDGGMGTLLQARGLKSGETPEDWNVERPDDIAAIHRAYVEAGSEVVYANTFGANPLKYHGKYKLEEVIRAGLEIARRAGEDARRKTLDLKGERTLDLRLETLVALDLGPTGKLLKPAGDLAFDDAVAAFAETIRVGLGSLESSRVAVGSLESGRVALGSLESGRVALGSLESGRVALGSLESGRVAVGSDPKDTNATLSDSKDPKPDLIVIETMGDVRELKAAVIAAKETCDLPVVATVSVGADGRLLTGASVECVAALLESLGVDAYGFNCGLGPAEMLPHVERLAKISTRPIVVKPNAGLPRVVDGRTVFSVGPEEFAADVAKLVAAGASVVGGCCGTTPEHIGKVAALCRSKASTAIDCNRQLSTTVSSGTSVVTLAPHRGLIIGERINPTGKKLLKEAYAKGDTAYVLREAVKQVDAGAAILDVNCGVPGLDEAALLEATVENVQGVATCPLQIDTADPAALERALRRANGKPLVNSVNGKRESMDAVFPLVRKYGGAIVALCLDESGIPPTSEGRLAIARRILDEGAKYGFAKNDFVFDALTLAVSSDPQAAVVTLETVRRLTDELGVNTVLGVSNVSFGLPNRPALNNAMYALAKRAGLSAAIANPAAIRDEIEPAAEDVLLGRDKNCAKWIESNSVAIGSNSVGLGSNGVGLGSNGVGLGSNGVGLGSNSVAIGSNSVGLESNSVAIGSNSVGLGSNGVGLGSDSKDPTSTLSDSKDPNLAAAIRRGLRDDARAAAAALLAAGSPPLAVIDGAIVPALEEVGRGFEKGTVFLPQLLMAADAAGEAFAAVKAAIAVDGNRQQSTADDNATRPIVLATVKGDIHDIGKNIVRALLENYGFEVIDLGRDVAPETIVETAAKTGAKLVGLSALMTTTVGAMAETIRRLKAAGLACRTVVGGAVVTEEYAQLIGADFYAKDAMATVRIAESLG